MLFKNGFNDIEAYNIAINLEREGELFYEAVAARTSSPEAKKMFLTLRDVEIKHRELFERLKAELTVEDMDYDYGDDEKIGEYLRALVDTRVFSQYGSLGEMTKEFASEIEALLLGAKAEQDSIAYYSALVDQEPENGRREAIKKIIAEEKAHLELLQNEIRRRSAA